MHNGAPNSILDTPCKEIVLARHSNQFIQSRFSHGSLRLSGCYCPKRTRRFRPTAFNSRPPQRHLDLTAQTSPALPIHAASSLKETTQPSNVPSRKVLPFMAASDHNITDTQRPPYRTNGRKTLMWHGMARDNDELLHEGSSDRQLFLGCSDL